MSGHRGLEPAFRAGAAAALAAVGLVMAPTAAVAQAQLQFQLQQLVEPMIAPFVPQADGAADAIGDPWWDEAEAQPPAAVKAPEAQAEDAEAEEPANAQAMLQAQLRAQAEMLAQNVRQQGLTILRRELSLVRQTCPSLEKQQRGLVLEAGRGAIDRAVDEQMQAAGGGRRRPAKRTDVEAAIRMPCWLRSRPMRTTRSWQPTRASTDCGRSVARRPWLRRSWRRWTARPISTTPSGRPWPRASPSRTASGGGTA